jgi:outer membrane protein assembly factor BamE (lipoprotein component of BamABCDE complex)
MNGDAMKPKIQVLPVVSALAFAFVAFLIFFISSEAVPVREYGQINEGMTEAQVLEILGAPHQVRQDASDRRVFFYGGLRRAKWCCVEVYFGRDGRVTGKFHDH